MAEHPHFIIIINLIRIPPARCVDMCVSRRAGVCVRPVRPHQPVRGRAGGGHSTGSHEGAGAVCVCVVVLFGRGYVPEPNKIGPTAKESSPNPGGVGGL